MEQIADRRLLYYDNFKKVPQNFNGAPLLHFSFKDVQTGKKIVLETCFYANAVSHLLGGQCYSQITDAVRDYDILWHLSDGVIGPVADTFEEVQTEYRRMLSEGVTLSEINSAMMELFKNKVNSVKHH